MHMPDQQKTRIPVGANAFWGNSSKGETKGTVLVKPTQDSSGSRLDLTHPSEATSQADIGFRPLSHPRVDHTLEGMVPSRLSEGTS